MAAELTVEMLASWAAAHPGADVRVCGVRRIHRGYFTIKRTFYPDRRESVELSVREPTRKRYQYRQITTRDLPHIEIKVGDRFRPAAEVIKHASQPVCPGSGRGGLMPGAGRNSAEEWDHFHAGELRCAWCDQFILHDEKGRLLTHERS